MVLINLVSQRISYEDESFRCCKVLPTATKASYILTKLKYTQLSSKKIFEYINVDNRQ